MDLHTLARAAGLVGGLCWVARLVLHPRGGGAASGALHVAGLALVAAAVVGAGADLVSTGATWLRAIVAVAFPLLVWSVLEVLHDGADPVTVDGLLGLVVAAVAGVGLARSRQREGGRLDPLAGAHAR